MGKVSLCNTQRSSGQINALVITERLREILAHQQYFPGGHVCVFGLISNLIRSSCLCLENKAAQARGSDINFTFRPDDNHHLIVHESAGLEPGDAHWQGLRAIRDFISNRTDPSRAAAERLHAIW